MDPGFTDIERKDRSVVAYFALGLEDVLLPITMFGEERRVCMVEAVLVMEITTACCRCLDDAQQQNLDDIPPILLGSALLSAHPPITTPLPRAQQRWRGQSSIHGYRSGRRRFGLMLCTSPLVALLPKPSGTPCFVWFPMQNPLCQHAITIIIPPDQAEVHCFFPSFGVVV